MRKMFSSLALLCAAFGASAQGQVNIICSVQAEWCSLMSTVYAKTTGVKVNMTAKGSGEALAQLNAEKANPKTDIWFGGTGDPHLQAAEQNLTLEYKSTELSALTLGLRSRLRIPSTALSVSTLARWALVTTPSCSPKRKSLRQSLGLICSSLNSRVKFKWRMPRLAVRLTPSLLRWCS